MRYAVHTDLGEKAPKSIDLNRSVKMAQQVDAVT